MKNESVTAECFIGKIFNFQPNNIINMLNAPHVFEKETKLYFSYLHSNAAWTSTVIHDCFL